MLRLQIIEEAAPWNRRARLFWTLGRPRVCIHVARSSGTPLERGHGCRYQVRPCQFRSSGVPLEREHPKPRSGGVLRRLGAILARLGNILGRLGRGCVVLGASWRRLGDVLGASWAILGAPWGCLGGGLGCHRASWGRPGGVLERLGSLLGHL